MSAPGLGSDGDQARGRGQPASSASELSPSPTGTRRRLRALAARAWSPEAIAREAGIPVSVIRRELDGRDDLLPGFDSLVAAVYDRLWDRDPPSGTRSEREAAQAAAERAVRSGWAPPMAWDDDLIDLPGAHPAEGCRPRRKLYMRAVDIVEDAEFVREHGGYRQAGIGEVAMRLGIRPDRLDQSYRRARRHAARDAAKHAGTDIEPEAEAG